MENVILRKSSRIIVDCSHFKGDNWTIFKIEYCSLKKTWEKNPNWTDKLIKSIDPLYFDKSVLSQDLQKKSEDEICQELKGKSVIITTSIWDK